MLWEGQDAKAMFKQSFRRIKLLGEGAFGAAYLVQQRDNEEMFHVAKEIKVNHLTEKERDGALDESTLLRSMSHPNIVSYVASFLDANKLYIVMEYADGGDLAHKIKEKKETKGNFREQKIMFYFVQIADALQYIHSQKILHRDLKPMNIFLTKNGYVKLGDFGIARVLESSTAGAQTTIGTPFYLSPEQCNSEPYGLKSDLWSLGVVTYELAALRVPFHATSLPAVAMAICSATPESLPKMYSKGLSKIVRQLLEKEPNNRPKLSEVLRVPYVRQYVDYLNAHRQEDLGTPSSTSELARTGADGFELATTAARSPAHSHDAPSANGRRDSRAEPRSQEVRQTRAELIEQQRQAAQEAARAQYWENQRLAQETRRRAQGIDGMTPRIDMEDEQGGSTLLLSPDDAAFGKPARRKLSNREELDKEKQRELERCHREAAEDRRIAMERKVAWQSRSQEPDTLGIEASPAEWLDEDQRKNSKLSSEESHRLALEKAHREAAEDRRFALQRKQEREAAERAAHPDLVSPASAPSPAWLGEADLADSSSSFAGSSKKKAADDDKLLALERARQETLEERRRLLEKFGKSQLERDEEEQSTAAPTESDAPLSDVLVFDFGQKDSRNRQSFQGSSAASRELPKDVARGSQRESPKDARRRPSFPHHRGSPKNAEAPAQEKRMPALQRGSPKHAEVEAGAATEDASSAGDSASLGRWRPEIWPDAPAEAPKSSDHRKVTNSRQVADRRQAAKGSRAKKPTERSDLVEARRQATLAEARRAGIQQADKLLDRKLSREAERQNFFRDKRNAAFAAKRRSEPDIAIYWPAPENVDLAPESTEVQQVDQADVLDDALLDEDAEDAADASCHGEGFVPSTHQLAEEGRGSPSEDAAAFASSLGEVARDDEDLQYAIAKSLQGQVTGSAASSPLRQSSGWKQESRDLVSSPSKSSGSSKNPLLAHAGGKVQRDLGSTARARELAAGLFNPEAPSPRKRSQKSPGNMVGSLTKRGNGQQLLAREDDEADRGGRAEFASSAGASPGNLGKHPRQIEPSDSEKALLDELFLDSARSPDPVADILAAAAEEDMDIPNDSDGQPEVDDAGEDGEHDEEGEEGEEEEAYDEEREEEDEEGEGVAEEAEEEQYEEEEDEEDHVEQSEDLRKFVERAKDRPSADEVFGAYETY